MAMTFMTNGFIALDKPINITSAAAVLTVKRLFKAKRVGHAGTLDPFASGLLVVALGEYTKLLGRVTGSCKEYTFTIGFGTSTDTLDCTGHTTSTSVSRPTHHGLIEVIKSINSYTQEPPRYSALKIAGRRAYDMAKLGEEFTLKPRLVELHWSRLVSFDGESAVISCSVGKGFYVRSYASDICKKLGVDGCVTALRRNSIGIVSHMVSIDEVARGLNGCVLPLSSVLQDGIVHCTEQEMRALRYGQRIYATEYFVGERLFIYNGDPVAIVTYDGGYIKPKRGFYCGVA